MSQNDSFNQLYDKIIPKLSLIKLGKSTLPVILFLNNLYLCCLTSPGELVTVPTHSTGECVWRMFSQSTWRSQSVEVCCHLQAKDVDLSGYVVITSIISSLHLEYILIAYTDSSLYEECEFTTYLESPLLWWDVVVDISDEFLQQVCQCLVDRGLQSIQPHLYTIQQRNLKHGEKSVDHLIPEI